MTACLEFKDVRKTYRMRRGISGGSIAVAAVAGVDLAVAYGETVGLVGESGCGKSTLARLAVRLTRPSGGRVFLDGLDAWEDSSLPGRMPEMAQMIFQDPFASLDPRMTIGQSVAEGLECRGLGNRSARTARVAELLNMVGLGPGHASRYPHQFSGGQRQRAAIARALALNPRLVVCDEPVSALDVSIQAQVINILEDLKSRLGLTYLFISHDLAVVSHLSDRVAVMYGGRLVELAPATELYAAPLHPYTRVLLAAVPAPDPGLRRASPDGLLRSRESLAASTAHEQGPFPAGAAPGGGGCPLAGRCADESEACAVSPPPWRAASPGHFVRCHAEHHRL
jgi:peptide/nickel transport system ATP-binding protein/oligopeptide transport system ATP-binding protein